MKKFLSLTLVAIMLLSTLMLTSCDAVMELLQQYISGLVPEVRYTVTEDEWNAAVKMENYTVTSKNEDGTVDVYKFSKDGYISDTEYGKKTYVFKDGNAYYLQQVGDSWVADSFGIDARTHTPLMLLDNVSFANFTYNEARKVYVYTEDFATLEVYFENGVMVKFAMIMDAGEKTLTFEYVISDVGTTVVDIPKYTMPDSHVHVEEIIPAVEATCAQTGLTEGKKCSECGEILVAQKKVSVPHTEVVLPAVEATCANTGLTEGKQCSECGKITLSQRVTNKLSHNYSEKVVEESTVNKKGSKELSCLSCGVTELVELPFKASEGLEYTLSDDGTYYTVDKGSFNGTELYIPKMYNDISVTSIGEFAFRSCTSLTSIEISDSVTSIGNYAFSGCTSLTTIEIPDSVISIGEYAFRSCTSLTSIEIPDSVTTMESGVFDGCTALTSVVIGDSVTSIGVCGFDGCTALTSVVIGDSVTSIGVYAFRDCTSLTSIEIPDSVISIGEDAFYECTALTSVTIGDSVTSIGEDAFYKCTSLTSIEIPDSVTSIERSAFFGCSSLGSVVIGDSVTSIGDVAFGSCTALTSVTIGDSLTNIGEYAFSYCSSLTSIEIPYSVTSIGDLAFCDCTSLTSIVIPDSVETMGWRVFSECSNLTIYCEAQSQPSGWDDGWNRTEQGYKFIPVVWGYTDGNRYTVTEEEFIAAVTVKNYTVTESDGTVSKYTEEGYIFGDGTISVFVDGIVYDLEESNGKWYAKTEGFSADSSYINIWMDWADMWDILEYNKSKKGYYAEDGGSSVLIQFKNGVLVRFKMSLAIGDSVSSVEYTFSDVGTTVIDIPEFTILMSPEELIQMGSATNYTVISEYYEGGNLTGSSCQKYDGFNQVGYSIINEYQVNVSYSTLVGIGENKYTMYYNSNPEGEFTISYEFVVENGKLVSVVETMIYHYTGNKDVRTYFDIGTTVIE